MKDLYYKYLNKFKYFLLSTLFKENIIIRNCTILEDGTIEVYNNPYERYGFINKNTLYGGSIECKICGKEVQSVKLGDKVEKCDCK